MENVFILERVVVGRCDCCGFAGGVAVFTIACFSNRACLCESCLRVLRQGVVSALFEVHKPVVRKEVI